MNSRRTFLRHALVAGAGLWLAPEAVLANPYRPAVHRALRGAHVRVRGRITSAGRPLAGVSVSDGINVARTAADGTFELLSTTRQRFTFLSLPAGHRIPTQDTGPARFFRPIVSAGEMEASWDLEPGQDDTKHSFLALGDTQTQTPFEMARLHDESVPDMIDELGSLGGAGFGIAVGDIMFDDLSLFPEYERAVRRIGLPFFQVVGNHDLNFDAGTDPDSVRTFERHFGPSYYSFDRGEVHYVVLDDVMWHSSGYIGHVGADQLAWLVNDLEHVEAGRTVVVFQHIPMLSTRAMRDGAASPSISGSVTNREHVYRLLERYNAHIISGHTHENEHVLEHGTHEHVLGTTCGAWWADDICHDGTPNGYAVYEARGSEIIWRYKATGMPAGHQMRLYEVEDSVSDRSLLANVWDWDPAWEVVWLEDGVRRGRMEPVTGLDPLAILRFDGPDKPSHRPWVQPIPTGHLLRSSLSDASGSIVVQATDRFGRTYSEELG